MDPLMSVLAFLLFGFIGIVLLVIAAKTIRIVPQATVMLVERLGRFDKVASSGLNLLVPFLKKLPKHRKFAVEIRNKSWLVPQFIEALREHGVALALIDQSWMPRPAQYFEKFDAITTDFTYVRWLGDRKAIETQTKVWDKIVVDRSGELSEWVDVLGKVYKRNVQIYTYANNHYAGFSPATVEMFRNLWHAKRLPEINRGRRFRQESSLSLFDGLEKE